MANPSEEFSELSSDEFSEVSSGDEELLYTEVSGYRFEPEYSAEELSVRRETEAVLPEELPTVGIDTQARSRVNENFWCSCGFCVGMSTEDESICCCESDRVKIIMDEFNSEAKGSKKCITQHPDFDAHINQGVLTTFFRTNRVNWKKCPRPQGPNGTLTTRQLRLVSYRHVLEWFLRGDQLGRDNRIPLPSCVTKMRNIYPSPTDEYEGYHWHR